MPHTIKLQKTAILKLHNPSAAKRRVLDLAFARYGQAYNLLLKRCESLTQSWLEAAEAGERLPALHRAMKQIYPRCPPARDLELPGALRDGLISDVAGNLLSYCRLHREWEGESTSARRDEKVAFEPSYPAPVYGYRPDAYFETLAQARSWVGDHEGSIRFQGRLAREAKRVVRPLHLCRARDFALGRLDDDRWGISINLQPRGHQPTRLRFPLAFGEWHEETYLDKGSPKCAHLCRREREYFLHVAFEFPVEVMEPEEAQSFLGIDRGITKQAAYALTNLQGRVLAVGSLGREHRSLQLTLGRYRQAAQKAGRRVTSRDWQRRHQEEILHLVANTIVQRAHTSSALVVLEDLDIRNSGRFVRSQYAKFAKILSYKLTEAGLPQPKKVFAANSSNICSKCGEMGERGGERFRCPACAADVDADENAAVNIARRVLYNKRKWENRGGYRAFHRSFSSV